MYVMYYKYINILTEVIKIVFFENNSFYFFVQNRGKESEKTVKREKLSECTVDDHLSMQLRRSFFEKYVFVLKKCLESQSH